MTNVGNVAFPSPLRFRTPFCVPISADNEASQKYKLNHTHTTFIWQSTTFIRIDATALPWATNGIPWSAALPARRARPILLVRARARRPRPERSTSYPQTPHTPQESNTQLRRKGRECRHSKAQVQHGYGSRHKHVPYTTNYVL